MLLDSSYLISLPWFPLLQREHLRGLRTAFIALKVKVSLSNPQQEHTTKVTMVTIIETTHLVKL